MVILRLTRRFKNHYSPANRRRKCIWIISSRFAQRRYKLWTFRLYLTTIAFNRIILKCLSSFNLASSIFFKIWLILLYGFLGCVVASSFIFGTFRYNLVKLTRFLVTRECRDWLLKELAFLGLWYNVLRWFLFWNRRRVTFSHLLLKI